MQKYRQWVDGLPFVFKIIFALPILDGIIYGIYRICGGTENILNLLLGIFWLFFGSVFGWIIDLIFIVLDKPVFELAR